MNFLIKSDENRRNNLNQRTHFKAMENLKMFKTSTVTHNVFKKIKCVKNLQRLKINRNSFNETMNSSDLLNGKINIINNKKNNVKHFSKKKNNSDEFNLESNNKDNPIHFSYDTINDSFNPNNKNKSINNLMNLRNNSYIHNRTKILSVNKKDFEDFNIIK